MKNLHNRIWITARTRMVSEKKALLHQNVSYLTVTYFTLFTIIGAIFSDFYSMHYSYLDNILLSASIVVLVASLVAGGFRFETKASTFRECYLKLQDLEVQILPLEEKSKKYTDLLSGYPNHSSSDYYDFIINHTFWEKKILTSGDDDLIANKYVFVSYFTRKIVFYLTLLILYFTPILFLAWPFLNCRGEL